ncbi:MAG: hypothetical protein IJA54_08030 [Tyzzerella sp.]|nr:hypothetical protein [Tyzzerella sp.]
MRYTEYHADKAVIKDRAFLPDAMEKLAKVEDLEHKNADIDKLTTEMMEHICDNLCKHPTKAKDQEELDEICSSCQMGQFVCDVLNTYNHIEGCDGCTNEHCTKELNPCRRCRRCKEDKFERAEVRE